jgi:hypothetical protein
MRESKCSTACVSRRDTNRKRQREKESKKESENHTSIIISTSQLAKTHDIGTEEIVTKKSKLQKISCWAGILERKREREKPSFIKLP